MALSARIFALLCYFKKQASQKVFLEMPVTDGSFIYFVYRSLEENGFFLQAPRKARGKALSVYGNEQLYLFSFRSPAIRKKARKGYI